MRYTASFILGIIAAGRERLFADYARNRLENWKVDSRTQDFVCLSTWLREELTSVGIDDHGRIVQQGVFSRYSRSDDDLFELAAQVMNDAINDNIDRDRKTHRRWG